jgi:hypothetical protein
MTDEPESLTRRFLRRLDTKMDQVIDTVREHSQRLTALEIAVGNLAAAEMTHYASTAARVDRMGERLDRIERRLDLTETG